MGTFCNVKHPLWLPIALFANSKACSDDIAPELFIFDEQRKKQKIIKEEQTPCLNLLFFSLRRGEMLTTAVKIVIIKIWPGS